MSSGSSHTSGGKPLGGLVLLARLILGGLFIFAGVIKVTDVQGFAFSVKAFEIVPAQAEHLIKMLAFVLPWTELVIGVCLVLGLWTRAAALLLSAILLAFVGGIISVVVRDLNVTCGCFGKYEIPCQGPIGVCHIARNAVLMLIALFVVWKGPGSLALDKQSK